MSAADGSPPPWIGLERTPNNAHHEWRAWYDFEHEDGAHTSFDARGSTVAETLRALADEVEGVEPPEAPVR